MARGEIDPDDNKVSLKKLLTHLHASHPYEDLDKRARKKKRERQLYGFCADLDSFSMMMCCTSTEKVYIDKYLASHREFDVMSVAPASKKIGLGASLLLMTIKALVWLFLWLTILNMPLLFLFN